MEITTIGSVLVDVFEAQAAIGLALLLIVVYTIVRGILVEHRSSGYRRHGGHR
jgi:hypothetical protein